VRTLKNRLFQWLLENVSKPGEARGELTLVRKLKNHLFQWLLENVSKTREAKREPLTGEEAKESPVPVIAGECPQA
jgi:hypothetical protein